MIAHVAKDGNFSFLDCSGIKHIVDSW